MNRGVNRSIPPVSAVYDCTVYVQAALRAYGPAGSCMVRAAEGFVTVAITEVVLAEIRSVLTRASVIRKNPQLTELRRRRFLEEIKTLAKMPEEPRLVFQLPRDPADEHYINLACAVNAEFLVTRDKDLLSLMEDEAEVAREFRSRFPYLRIVDPVAFRQLLDERNGSQRSSAER